MKRNKKLSRKVHETGLLDLLTGSGRPCTSRSCVVQPGALMVQLTDAQHTCQLVFKPKADILNMHCDCQFVFSVLDELYASRHAWCNRCCSKSAVWKYEMWCFYFHKIAYIQYLGEVDIFHTWVKKFIPLYNSAKIIKIDRDFPKLWSQMYCHLFLWFTVYTYSL